MRILLVEDNDRLAGLTAAAIAEAGFAVDRVELADEAEAALEVAHYDTIVLDLGLPDGDGMEVLKALRNRGDGTPVLILTARGSLDDRVEGLNAGADDYVLKPFEMEELIARIKALTRRPGGALGVTLTLGNVAYDTVARQITVAGAPVSLTPREHDVFEHLMRRARNVVTKSMLEDTLYGFNDAGGANSVEVAVHRLRKKLAEAGADLQIHTLRGVGYLMAPASGAEA